LRHDSLGKEDSDVGKHFEKPFIGTQRVFNPVR
jgi:hypothetical protein